jgi:hypothetical protein
MKAKDFRAMPTWQRIALVADQIAQTAEIRQPRDTKRLQAAEGKLLAIWEQLQTSAKGKIA